MYTGTHDNDTTLGWYESSTEEIRGNFRNYLNVSGDSPSWDLLRFAYRTISPLVVVPAGSSVLGFRSPVERTGFRNGKLEVETHRGPISESFSGKLPYLRLQAEITGRLPPLFALESILFYEPFRRRRS